MRIKTLPTDYAIVLQQIYEAGQEEFGSLAESLQFDRKRLTHIVESLRHKGLVKSSEAYASTWITLSGKGQRLITVLWPETSTMARA